MLPSVWYLPQERARFFITNIQIFLSTSSTPIFSSACFPIKDYLLFYHHFHSTTLPFQVHAFTSSNLIRLFALFQAPCPPPSTPLKMHHRMYNSVLIQLQQDTQQIKGTFHCELTHPLSHITILTLKLTLRPIDKSLVIALRSKGCSARIHLSESAGF